VLLASQIGLFPPHPLLSRHSTQLLMATLHFIGAVQPLLSVHCTQAPLAAQAGVAGFFNPHSLPPGVHALHLLSPPQMGLLASLQSELATHSTHLLELVLQVRAGATVQVLLSVHCTQVPASAPDRTHAGVAALFFPHRSPAVQAVQTPLLQRGFFGSLPQPASSRHSTHFLVLVSQSGLAKPAQSVCARH
jgi:hypothetical protein